MSRRRYSEHSLLAPWMVIVGGMLWSAGAIADSGNADGQQGELHIEGAFMAGPCRLDMRSAFQDISLDSAALANLHKPGDTGLPQQVTFHLSGCRMVDGTNEMLKKETEVMFLAAADSDEPTLFLLSGVTGVALRLEDSNGRMLAPGESRHPVFQASGYDLVYTATLVRTKAPLQAGEFTATVDFGIRYE